MRRLWWPLVGVVALVPAALLMVRDEPSEGPPSVVHANDEGAVASPSLADEQAIAGVLVDRVQLFRDGNLGPRFALDGPEMTALLRHAAPGIIPPGVSEPAVSVRDRIVLVEAKVARHEVLPPSDGFSLPDMLPDTVRVVLRGEIRSAPGDRLRFTVLGARVGRIPLPRSVIAAVVEGIPGGEDRGVAASTEGAHPAISLRVPAGIGDVAVMGEEVVFFRSEPFADRAVDGSDP